MKILVGMSGGVDSSVAAYLLKKEGNEVIGLHFNFVNRDKKVLDIPEKLKEVANKLDIELIAKDYSEEFNEKIINSFVHDYESGITPNPCALCNGMMKFEKLLQVMKEENCDAIATGHYAKIENKYIRKSQNAKKDQSYMLYRLSEEQRAKTIFPIGDMDKNDVRMIAKEIGLSVAGEKDSQDVCFISKDKSYVDFIKEYEFGSDYKEKILSGKLKLDDIYDIPYLKKGMFVDIDGKVLGYHKGIINYTIGQRKGLNIAFGERKFVKEINVASNQVVLCDNDELYSDEFNIYDIVFSKLAKDSILNSYNEIYKVSFIAKLRYRHEGTMCDVYFKKNTDGSIEDVATCHLHEKVRAITRGQAAVFYDDNDYIMFGGRIK